MLLRSASTPVLKCEAVDLGARISSTRSSFTFLQRTVSEDNLVRKRRLPSSRYKTVFSKFKLSPVPAKENEEMNVCGETALSLLGGNGSYLVTAVEEEAALMWSNGAGGNGGGGKRGRTSGYPPGPEPNGSESVDEYYQNMIRKYPENALLVANYALYLQKVRHDLVKAEYYCEKAIQTGGCDGILLSMFADLIWTNHGDAPRAKYYFEKAIKASPDDCYIQGAYAHFLWVSEYENEEEYQPDSLQNCASAHNLSQRYPPPPPPLAAA